MEKIAFRVKDGWERYFESLREIKSPLFVNFLNSHDLYFFAKDSFFRETLEERNVNFVDGFVVSAFLSTSNFKRVKRFSGTEFMIEFLSNSKLSKGKHLFLGSNENDLDLLTKKFRGLKKKDIFCYNPPYIKDLRFPKEEIGKIRRIIISKKIDFVWVGLGCPKQNFLSYDISRNFSKKRLVFLNVGAAMDFVLLKKKKAPKIFLKTGTEWFYRLITDFNHSKKKVLRSFASLIYLSRVELEK